MYEAPTQTELWGPWMRVHVCLVSVTSVQASAGISEQTDKLTLKMPGKGKGAGTAKNVW